MVNKLSSPGRSFMDIVSTLTETGVLLALPWRKRAARGHQVRVYKKVYRILRGSEMNNPEIILSALEQRRGLDTTE